MVQWHDVLRALRLVPLQSLLPEQLLILQDYPPQSPALSGPVDPLRNWLPEDYSWWQPPIKTEWLNLYYC